jgi:hypothetical protein
MPERVPAAAPELSLSLLGKLLATIGLVLAFPAIWVDAVGSESYWHQSSGHAVGAAMLVLAVVSLVLLAANLAQPRSVPERAYSIPGLVLGGLFLFVPFEFVSEHSELLKTGAWLGVAAALTLALGSIVTAVAGRSGGMELKAGRRGLGQALTGLGIVLVFPAIWTDFVASVSYWDTSLGHGVGTGMLVLAIGAGLLLLASLLGAHSALFPIPALVVAGLLLFVPLEAAFDHLGELKVGAWLGIAACLAIALGSITMVFTGSATPAAGTTSPPPQPRAAAPTELDLPPTTGGAAPTELDLPPAESPPTGQPVETIAAGWYPDPSGESRLRYWDGSGWTEHTR